MNIQERLQTWAEKTVASYHKIASREEVNLAYYTQSDLSIVSEDPELMIVGINPGSGGSYTEQCNNKNWSYLYYNKLDEKHLLKGNYCKEEGKPSSWDCHRKWKYWNGLKRCLSNTYLEEIIDNDSKIIITNASFFSTEKANEIPESLLIETIPYTLDLIEESNPKHVVFLSGKKCFERLEGLKKAAVIEFEYKHICGNIYVGVLNKKMCIGIPHPTYKTSEELDLVASVLPYLISANNYDAIDTELINRICINQIKAYEKRIKSKSEQKAVRVDMCIDKAFIEQEVGSRITLPSYDKKNNRYVLSDTIGVTITRKDGGCVELRPIDYNHHELTQELLNTIKEKLLARGYFTPKNVWIGRKLFSSFGRNNEEVIQSILCEIEELKTICIV